MQKTFLDPNTFLMMALRLLAGLSFSKDGSTLPLNSLSEGVVDWRKVM